MPKSDRIAVECAGCHQTDDHPKAHLGEVSKHHDCLSQPEKAMLYGSVQTSGSGPKVSAVIEACEAGARGADLLKLIQSGELPQAEGLHEKAARAAEKG